MAKSDNRWARRASSVTLIKPARKGKFLNDIYCDKDTCITNGDGINMRF